MSLPMGSLQRIDGRQGRVVLITGGAGFIGCVLAVRLMEARSPVVFNFEMQTPLANRCSDRKSRGFWYDMFLAPLRYWSRNNIRHCIDDFCAASLSWIERCSDATSEELERARSLSENVINFIDSNPCQEEWPFASAIRCLSSYSGHATGDIFREATDELGGLVFYLAAKYKGSLDWLGKNEIERDAFLVSSVSEAFWSIFATLHKCRNEFKSISDLSVLHRLVLTEQFNHYGIRIKYENLGKLRACLISTKFGLAVHLNERLSTEEQEFACFHEMGHLMLRHRANSEYALDPGLLTSRRTTDEFVRQEREANGFAELWRYILHTMAGGMFMGPSARQFDGEAQSTTLEPTEAVTQEEPELCRHAH